MSLVAARKPNSSCKSSFQTWKLGLVVRPGFWQQCVATPQQKHARKIVSKLPIATFKDQKLPCHCSLQVALPISAARTLSQPRAKNSASNVREAFLQGATRLRLPKPACPTRTNCNCHDNQAYSLVADVFLTNASWFISHCRVRRLHTRSAVSSGTQAILGSSVPSFAEGQIVCARRVKLWSARNTRFSCLQDCDQQLWQGVAIWACHDDILLTWPVSSGMVMIWITLAVRDMS